MPQLTDPYLHMENVLSFDDIQYLKEACKRQLFREGIPCFVLIRDLEAPTVIKIKAAIERRINESLYYLNDFYMYTDSSFRASWHMDTELFSFEDAVNAWILLSPNLIESPLAFVNNINRQPENVLHDVRISGDECKFANYCTGEETSISLRKIESERIQSPCIKAGDILLFNPKQFHRTNVNFTKHVLVLKFLIKGAGGFLARSQVNETLWPEVGMFNKFLKDAQTWDSVLDRVRGALKSDEGRKALSAGFYPAKFDLYRRMVTSL
jgi:hypothetical protein